MLTNRFEPTAEILDWATYKGTKIAKGRLVSRKGLVAEIGEIGAALVALRLPDDEAGAGAGDPLVWEFSHPLHYLFSEGAVGGVIGPVANRLGQARAPLGKRELSFTANEGENLLHSGAKSSLYRFWNLKVKDGGILCELELAHRADGFPGLRMMTAHYSFNEAGDALHLRLGLTTTRPTLVNMTHHPYWNLGGGAPLSEHRLEVPATGVVKVDENRIPTGELGNWTTLGANFSKPTSLDLGKKAFDAHLVLPEERAFNARLTLPGLNRSLTIESDKPGVQVFTRAGGTLPAPEGAEGVAAVEGLPEAVCLEPQLHPDAPNHEDFPSIELKPRETYEHNIVYRFDW